MTDKLKTESGRSLPQAPTFFERHAGDRDAILAVIATLERAANTSNGDLFDSVLSEEMPRGLKELLRAFNDHAVKTSSWKAMLSACMPNRERRKTWISSSCLTKQTASVVSRTHPIRSSSRRSQSG
jgi:hypothetical protein